MQPTLTPFKTTGGSAYHHHHDNRHSSSTGGDYHSSSDAAMDESSVLSSPPRSASRTPRGRSHNLFFPEDDEAEPEEETAFLRLGRRGSDQRGTPRNRRLFADDDDDEDEDNHDGNHGEPDAHLPPAPRRLTPKKNSPVPPRARTTHVPHRPTLKVLDLNNNHSDNVNSSMDDDDDDDSAGNATSSLTRDSEASGPSSPVEPQSRKRSSAERRGHAEGDQMHVSSPHISPNSFLTMDGRFVHSKNPFSSPMMTEDQEHNNHHHTAVGAPQLPEDGEYTKNESSKYHASPKLSPKGVGGDKHSGAGNDSTLSTGFLAPRQKRGTGMLSEHHQNGTGMTPFGGGTYSYMNGFPDQRFSFTGSPIPENKQHHHQKSSQHHSGTNGGATSGSEGEAMDMDTVTGGSFQKVRRLNIEDDVFSASGHTVRSYNQQKQQNLAIDTSIADDMSCTSNSSLSSHNTLYHSRAASNNTKIDNDPSPTDVLSFPFPPPTPSKSTASPSAPSPANSFSTAGDSAYHYRSVRKPIKTPVPPTPVAERRRQAALAARTPHPGSYLHNNNRGSGSDKNSSSRFYGDFDVIGELGDGAFGKVYRVLSRLDGCMYAIKAAKRQAKGPGDRDRMLKEVYALAALSDQAHLATFHIVRYHQAWMEEDRLYIQTELCQGNLAGEMARGLVPINRRFKLLREICLALEFLHKHAMVHLDIKPDNIFIKNDQFKLGDFGLVTKTSSHQDVEEGDSRYMSMELLEGDHSDLTKSDIFSLGATVYEICRGQPLPLNGPEWQDIRSGRLAPLPDSDGDMIAIVEHMMHPDYRQRPAANDLLKRHQLLSDEQKALMAERTKVAELQKFQFTNGAVPTSSNPAAQLKSPPVLPTRSKLTRASTWNGSSFANPYI